MHRILELSPVVADAFDAGFPLIQGVWNAHRDAEALARGRGHRYLRPSIGGVSDEYLDAVLAAVDAIVLAPTNASAQGVRQPGTGEEAGRELGRRLLERLSSERPDLHIVLVSHFLVGHGIAHRNAKEGTWALRALEAHLRSGRNPWTILRPTWLSTIHDDSYQTRLSQDPYADGLVSTRSIADAVLTAVEHADSSIGRTASVFNLSVPGVGVTDLATQFSTLEPDFEATQVLVAV